MTKGADVELRRTAEAILEAETIGELRARFSRYAVLSHLSGLCDLKDAVAAVRDLASPPGDACKPTKA